MQPQVKKVSVFCYLTSGEWKRTQWNSRTASTQMEQLCPFSRKWGKGDFLKNTLYWYGHFFPETEIRMNSLRSCLKWKADGAWSFCHKPLRLKVIRNVEFLEHLKAVVHQNSRDLNYPSICHMCTIKELWITKMLGFEWLESLNPQSQKHPGVWG